MSTPCNTIVFMPKVMAHASCGRAVPAGELASGAAVVGPHDREPLVGQPVRVAAGARPLTTRLPGSIRSATQDANSEGPDGTRLTSPVEGCQCASRVRVPRHHWLIMRVCSGGVSERRVGHRPSPPASVTGEMKQPFPPASFPSCLRPYAAGHLAAPILERAPSGRSQEGNRLMVKHATAPPPRMRRFGGEGSLPGFLARWLDPQGDVATARRRARRP